MAAPAFSRLQLAAALIEYDNDPSNPNAPYRSAHDSAIFAHLRQNGMMRPPAASRQSDYLGVSLPSENGSVGGRESALDNRRSRGSLDALRNPFGNGADDTADEDDVESHEDLEVDLASWGLDAFMPKDKGSKGKGKGKAKAKADHLPNPYDTASRPQHSRAESEYTSRRSAGHRSMSLGNVDIPNDGSIPIANIEEHRRRSFGSPLDAAGVEPIPLEGSSSSGAQEATRVPFPSKSVRSPSPAPSHVLSEGGRNRVNSNATMATAFIAEDNPFALEPPKHASRFDPKAALHARTISNASMGSRVLLDRENDATSVMTGLTGQPRDRPYSTVELLRPKVLVMPSPLQSTNIARPPSPAKGRDGFEITTDGPPLPPGARSARPASMLTPSSSLSPPIPSNSFIPNPRTSLTLSQLTFRNQLMVGGQRDVAYADLDNVLPRATEEGEQIHTAMPNQAPDLPLPLEDPSKKGRPAGKLYGSSLIDELENRKIQMRNKQRVFTGDQRPSMMARGQPTRSSTLIDPATLQAPPNRNSAFGIPQGPPQNLVRRNSSNIKPLLNFDDDTQTPPGQSRGPQMINSRSVFGVDTLWEREMAKLKVIEEQERLAAEAREKEEVSQVDRKGKKKKKGKGKNVQDDEVVTPEPKVEEEPMPRVSAEPPVLPDIPKAVRRPPPPPTDDEDESEESDDLETPARKPNGQAAIKGWDSSDEEDQGPRRTTGTGPRYPPKAPHDGHIDRNDDSEEDIPLAAAIDRVAQRATRAYGRQDESDDEEKPLSALLRKASLPQPSTRSNNLLSTSDDEDDQPLGLRASRVMPSMGDEGGDDDDTPLALHPEQQRRTQYQMMAQAQQQHQFMMQAQNNMFLNPAMMTSGFFGPQIPPPMMVQAPMPIPSPPPLHDSAKFGRVDRWRRDVAVEGSH